MTARSSLIQGNTRGHRHRNDASRDALRQCFATGEFHDQKLSFSGFFQPVEEKWERGVHPSRCYNETALYEHTMEKYMLEDIKELFQAFIAPQLEGIKGDIRALDAKIGALDAKIGALDTKGDAQYTALDAKISALDTKIDSKTDLLDAKIGALDSKVECYRRELLAEVHRVEQTVGVQLVAMAEKMDLFRREMLAEIKAASK